MKKFTIDDLRKLDPCTEALEWAEKQTDAATAWETCPRGDWLLWLLERIRPLTKEQSVRLAIEFAKQALPQFQAVCPNDQRPALAIQAAEDWLANPNEQTKSAAWSAAWSAADAADAACSAADAAWNAAWSAARSAADAADAAWSAADAADAACSAADAADAAWNAAWSAACSAADAACSAADAAWSAACSAQAGVIRKIVPNPFRRTLQNIWTTSSK